MLGLLHQLGIATVIVSATIVIHLLGLDALQMLVRLHLRKLARWLDLNRLVVPLGIVLGLFLLHGVEIWLYALVYHFAGVLGTLEQALYFSTSAYSTVGETGALLPASWRIIGVLESVNGMLLIGWSTAFLFQVLQHLTWEEEEEHQSLPKGAIARGRRKRQQARGVLGHEGG
jgi:voltage-gated potassium channel